MNKCKVKDIAVRAGKTFLQAFLASITVDVTLLNADASMLRTVFLSAAAAGISAVMNACIAALDEKKW